MPDRPKRRIDVNILEPFKGELCRSWLRRAASRALAKAFPKESCQLSLVIADDDTVKDLNREYRGLDETTDVLSFATFHQGHWEGEGEPRSQDDGVCFVFPIEEPQPLGEVIISYPQVLRQAGSEPGGVDKELALLVAHGVLHLVGFDHLRPGEEADMQAKERQILSSIFP